MKKLIIVATLLFAFSINSNAQEMKGMRKTKNEQEVEPTKKRATESSVETEATESVVEKVSSESAGKKEATELAAYLGLDENERENFARLFIMKHRALESNELSDERKSEMKRTVEAKIRASLQDGQMEKLENNKELFKKLLN